MIAWGAPAVTWLADVDVRDDYGRFEGDAIMVHAGVRAAQIFHEPGHVI